MTTKNNITDTVNDRLSKSKNAWQEIKIALLPIKT